MTTIQLTVTVDEANAILDALGQMPYVQVYQLIGKIQQQATVQIREDQHLSLERNGQSVQQPDQMGGL